ncbi:hypothetical protein RFI_12451, partial [Reticulomyxa filosa]
NSIRIYMCIFLKKKLMRMFKMCAELLLAVIEMTQFQQQMETQMDSLKEYHDESALAKIRLPPDIPKSVLVFDTASNQEIIDQFKQHNSSIENNDPVLLYFKVVAYRIYQKYIRVGSELSFVILTQKK